jgi:hypothetical protein
MCMSRARRAQTPFELCQYIKNFKYGNVEKSKELVCPLTLSQEGLPNVHEQDEMCENIS